MSLARVDEALEALARALTEWGGGVSIYRDPTSPDRFYFVFGKTIFYATRDGRTGDSGLTAMPRGATAIAPSDLDSTPMIDAIETQIGRLKNRGATPSQGPRDGLDFDYRPGVDNGPYA